MGNVGEGRKLLLWASSDRVAENYGSTENNISKNIYGFISFSTYLLNFLL